MKIFIGSSSEARPVAQAIFDLLNEKSDVGISPHLWWNNRLFPTNFTIIESLLKNANDFDAAIFVFSEDDDTNIRGQEQKTTRDNVVFEYGLFSGKLDRQMLAIARYKRPKPLSDLAGVMVINLQGNAADDYFKDMNRTSIHDWVASIKEHADLKKRTSREDDILRSLGHLRRRHPEMGDKIDVIMAGLSGASDYMDNHLIDNIAQLIFRGCTGIYALDVVGPNGWTNSNTYKYLAPQLKQYLRMNISSDEWNLLVSRQIETAILRSIENARARGFRESETEFDNPKEFGFKMAENFRLEFSRILLWSKSELLTSVAESVIAIHEAFHVPLFFIETDEQEQVRNLDYILFRKNGTEIYGLEGERSTNFRTKVVNEKRGKQMLEEYFSLLGNNNIMFAMDARTLAKR